MAIDQLESIIEALLAVSSLSLGGVLGLLFYTLMVYSKLTELRVEMEKLAYTVSSTKEGDVHITLTTPVSSREEVARALQSATPHMDRSRIVEFPTRR